MIDTKFFRIQNRNVLAARAAMNKWIAEQGNIEVINIETIVKQKGFIFGGICLAGLRLWYKQASAVKSTETEAENSKTLAQRAVFESLLLGSAQDGGFDSNINFDRNEECNESYADGHVQAAWYGFREGINQQAVKLIAES